MATVTPPDPAPNRQEALDRAHRAAEGYKAAEENLTRWRKARDKSITELYESGVSWAEIGRTFGITPQAAMYASGLRKRTGR